MEPLLKIEIYSIDEAKPYEQLFKDCPHALIQQSTYWADVISPISNDTPYFLVAYGKDSNPLGGLPLYHFQGDLGGILTSVPHAGRR